MGLLSSSKKARDPCSCQKGRGRPQNLKDLAMKLLKITHGSSAVGSLPWTDNSCKVFIMCMLLKVNIQHVVAITGAIVKSPALDKVPGR